MIQLGQDVLYFETPAGGMVPCSAELIAGELLRGDDTVLDPEVLTATIAAVMHYFKSDLRREKVTVQEFIDTLRTVLKGIGVEVVSEETVRSGELVVEYDLTELIDRSVQPMELTLYPRLRHEMHRRLNPCPELLRIRGLRRLVKHFVGVRRWNRHCEVMSDQILLYLRRCLHSETGTSSCPMLVE